MAAPCGRMASRSLLHFLSGFRRPAAAAVGGKPGLRVSFSSLPALGETLQTGAGSPWTVMAAVCLQRLPVISADCSLVEQRVKEMLQQMEFEKSVLSDHEQRLLEDAERLSRKQADDYDSDEEDNRRDQEIVLAQDLEDSWEQRMKKFQPAERVRADVDVDVTSLERCLDDSLLLLAEQQVGGEKMWLLPQTQWQDGETLRQTAERALASLPAAFKATFLGNAPCGVYKYKLPRAARTESAVGTKVFFFKAVLSDAAPPAAAPSASLLWLKKDELQRYLKPAYMMKVERFVGV